MRGFSNSERIQSVFSLKDFLDNCTIEKLGILIEQRQKDAMNGGDGGGADFPGQASC